MLKPFSSWGIWADWPKESGIYPVFIYAPKSFALSIPLIQISYNGFSAYLPSDLSAYTMVLLSALPSVTSFFYSIFIIRMKLKIIIYNGQLCIQKKMAEVFIIFQNIKYFLKMIQGVYFRTGSCKIPFPVPMCMGNNRKIIFLIHINTHPLPAYHLL